MYIMIDMDRMVFLRKHPDLFLLTDLAIIECPNISISIQPCDASTFLKGETDYELKLLYNNTTNSAQTFYGDGLRAVLGELVHRMPVTDAIVSEVTRQADALGEDNKVPHCYVKGSKSAIKSPSGALRDGFVTTVSPDEALFNRLAGDLFATLYPDAAQQAKAQAAQRAPMVQANSSARGSGAPALKRNTGAPRSGNVRGTIWEVADKMWEDAGKPTDKKDVLTLRKSIMDTLESTHNVKRTSSSNELGNWQKARI